MMEGVDLDSLRATIEKVAAGGWGGFAAIAIVIAAFAAIVLRSSSSSKKDAVKKQEAGGRDAPASIKAQVSANESALDRLERKGDLP